MAEKRQQLKKVDAEKLLSGIYFAKFTDGTEFAADLADVNPEMQRRFMLYGLKQKLDDSMAGSDTIEDAFKELSSTWEAIKGGQWTIRVPGEGVEGGLFAQAYAEFHSISLADAKAKISGLVERNVKLNQEKAKSKEEAEKVTERRILNSLRDAALERNPGMKVIYDTLKAKREERAKAARSASLTIETD